MWLNEPTGSGQYHSQPPYRSKRVFNTRQMAFIYQKYIHEKITCLEFLTTVTSLMTYYFKDYIFPKYPAHSIFLNLSLIILNLQHIMSHKGRHISH